MVVSVASGVIDATRGVEITAEAFNGGSIVVADAGLGVRPMAGALRSADPDLVVGIPAGLAAARALGVEGDRIVVRPTAPGAVASLAERVADADLSLESVQAAGAASPVALAAPAIDAEAAVLVEPDAEEGDAAA